MADPVQDMGAHRFTALPGDGGIPIGLTPSRRRRPPSNAEQERRKAWGNKWGQLIGNLTRIDKEHR